MKNLKNLEAFRAKVFGTGFRFFPPMRSAVRRFIQLLAVLPLLAVSGTLWGQVQTYRHFDERDGLPQSQVSCLLEDNQGFLWAGTSEGVARLGASGFQAFGAAQGLKALDVSALVQDREGAIWVAGFENGIDRLRGSRIAHFGEAQGLAEPSVFCLFEDGHGALYAGTRTGLFRRRGDRFEAVDLPGGWARQPIFAIAEDPRGGLWLGSSANRLGLWDGRSLRPATLPEPMKSRFRGLQTDASGRVWALCADALYRMDGDGVWRRDPLPGFKGKARLRSFLVSAKGELLLSMDVDGAYLRGPGGEGRTLTYLDGIPRDGVAALLRDSRGNLWIGTDGAGLLAEAVPGLLGMDRDPRTGVGLGMGTVVSFALDGPDRMLLGSSSGLHLWERGRGIVGRWNSDLGVVWSLAPRRAGGFWAATLKGIVSWDAGRVAPGPRELERVAVSSLLVKGERLWAATFERGLVEMDLQGRVLASYPAPAEVGEPAIVGLVSWEDGLLVATRYGVYRFQGGAYRPVLRDSPVGTSSISCFCVGDRGALWVGTASGGAFEFPRGLSGPCVPYGEAEARIHGRVGWISQLDGGDVAVGHARGITILRAAPGGARRVLQITRNQGLLSNETSDSAVIRDAGGRLWIGMVGGFCILEGTAGLSGEALPAPRFLEVSAGAASACLPSGTVALPPNPETLTLSFDVARPLLAEAPAYQVWVDGRWRDVESGSNRFQIARLGPGTYPVRVRATTGLGWSESDTVIIRVRAAWYQTYLARGLLLLSSLALAAHLISLRMKSMRRRARELESKVAERTRELTLRNRSLERLHHQLKRSFEGRIQLMNTISHDLRSPLTTILLTVELLEERGELSEKGLAALRVLGSEAQRVERLLRTLLDGARAESVAEGLHFRLCRPGEVLEGMADTLRFKAESLELGSGIRRDGAEGGRWILADVEALQQVLFNLVENALKFTEPPGEVGIRSRIEEARWILEVWDTGRGIEPEKVATLFRPFQQAREVDATRGWGLGLSICQVLVAAHDGTIDVESSPGKGSVFRVVLPLVVDGP